MHPHRSDDRFISNLSVKKRNIKLLGRAEKSKYIYLARFSDSDIKSQSPSPGYNRLKNQLLIYFSVILIPIIVLDL